MALDFWYNEAEKKEQDEKWKQDFKNIGGVDSTFLLKVAHDTLGEKCIAYPNREKEIRKGHYRNTSAKTSV